MSKSKLAPFRKGLAFVIVGLLVFSCLTCNSSSNNKAEKIDTCIKEGGELNNEQLSKEVFNWPTFHHDNWRTGYTNGKSNIIGPQVNWTFPTGKDFVIGRSSSPALGDIDDDGIMEVVVGSLDSHVYALNGTNGHEDWKFPAGSPVSSSPALGDSDGDGKLDVVVVGDWSGRVYVLNGLDNGFVVRDITTGGSVDSSPAIDHIDGDGKPEFVVGSNDGNVYAAGVRNDDDGFWVFPTDGPVISSPAIGHIDHYGGIDVVVGSDDGNIYALHGANGTEIWRFPTGHPVRSSPALGDIDGDGILDVIVGSDDGNIYAIKGTNCNEIWRFPTDYGVPVCSSPALADIDGDRITDIIIVGCDDGTIYALNTDGDVVWRFSTDESVVSSPALADIDSDGILDVVVGSDDGNIYAVNIDGYEVWRFSNGVSVDASPALGDIDDDGNIEVVSSSFQYSTLGNYNVIYALDGDDIPPKVEIIRPVEEVIYVNGRRWGIIENLTFAVVIGNITVMADISDEDGSGLDRVEFWLDYLFFKIKKWGYPLFGLREAIAIWNWRGFYPIPVPVVLVVKAYDKAGNEGSDRVLVIKWNPLPLPQEPPDFIINMKP